MEKITSIRQGVEKLLQIRGREIPDFALEPQTPEEYTDTLLWQGNRIPLFYSRYEPPIRAVAGYGNHPESNSALNVYAFTGRHISLEQLIYRELDIAEFVLHSRVKKITAFVNQNAANIIAVMENGTAANLDLGNTMAEGAHQQCQHRLITDHGMANDRGVTDMIVQHQVYVFGQEGTEAYDDDEYYLYGLDEDEVAKVLTVHAILTGKLECSDFAERDMRLRKMVEAVYESDRRGQTVSLD